MAFITTSKKTIVHVFLLTTSLLWSACRSDANRCKDPANGMIPIYDLGVSPYRGYTGGLYPLGSNRIPASHFAAGMHQGSQLQPLNGDGEPAADGLVGCMSLGYSTAAMTTQYVRFIHQIKQEWPELLIANAAQAGKDLNAMTAADHAYWQQSISMILEQGLTPEQVQIIWLSTSDATVYDLPFPEQPRVQLDKYQTCLKLIREYFPNVRIVFVSDRAYGGYISEKIGFSASRTCCLVYFLEC